MKHKVLSLILTLSLLLSILAWGSPAVSAAEVVASGSCGENAVWTVYDDRTLVISGTGRMRDWDYWQAPGWRQYDFEHIIFEEGITYVGAYAFYSLTFHTYSEVKSVTFRSDIPEIGYQAFGGLFDLESVYINDLEEWCSIDFYFDGHVYNPLDCNADLYANGVLIDKLVIPESITSVRSGVFKGCTSLTHVVIPAHVKEICGFAFNSCSNLKEMYFMGDAPAFGKHVFTLTNVTAYYPQGNNTWTEELRQSLSDTVTWVPYDSTPFEDVQDPMRYYYKSVGWAYSNGITSGITPASFSPDGTCTRGQVVTFLWRAAGKPLAQSDETVFTDLKEDSFYYDAVLWASENGIVKGLDETTFGPNEICTRAQVVTFLWRFAGCPEVESAEHSFTDVNAEAFYYKAMLWAVEEGITSGMSSTTFSPEGQCTRGQVVTFLWRYDLSRDTYSEE